MATIDFNGAAKYTDALPHRVYTRAAWGDAWTLRPDLVATQCVWNAAPQVSTATLVRDYGLVMQPGGTATTTLAAVALEGDFVLIEWDNDESGINYWLGVVDGRSDAPDGVSDGTIPASGRQSFACYGMERLLQVAPIVDTVWDDGTGSSTRSGGATPFNQGGVPNRSASIITGETFVFDPDPTAAEFWSSRDIVQHLLEYHLPTGTGAAGTIPWTLAGASLVPDWDSPEIETEGLTVWEVLNRILDSRMLLGWAAGFDHTSLAVAPFSLAASTISLGAINFPANPTQHAVNYASDPLTAGELTVDRADVVDQVVVRGARRVSVCTLRVEEGDLEAGWETADEDDYLDGASGDTDYGTWDIVRQREANETVRRGQVLQDVFSLLTLTDAYGWQVDDDGTPANIFPPISGSDPHEPYRGAVRILPSLPLRRGVDYSGDPATPDPYAPGDFRPPLLMLPDETITTRIIDTEGIGTRPRIVPGTGESIDYTIGIETDPDRLAVRVLVSGAPQHMVAGASYTALAADEVRLAHWDLLKARITVAMVDDRYCEATEPATAPSTDVVRRRIFHVGDAYQQIYIVPGTVVEINAANEEVRSDGGYLRDDTVQLQQLAKLLAAYHTSPRTSLSVRTYRRTGLANVGDMVATADGVSVGAVITRIQIDNPLGDGGPSAPRSVQEITATAAELDLLATLAIAARAA